MNGFPKGLHTIQIADDTKLWVRSKGDIRISCLVDGKYKQGILCDVFFVPKLKRNLFSVGLVSKGNLSFVTFPGRCEFRTLSGKTILEGTRLCKLYQLFLKVLPPPKLMDISSLTSTYLVFPYESWFGTKPSIEHYKIFGSIAWVFVNKERRTKLDPKSIRTYFVGYCATSKAYRFWEPLTDKIIESSDYTIDEKSSKYDSSFRFDPSCDNCIHLMIDTIFPTSDSVMVSPPIPHTIDDSSNENLEDFPISGSQDQLPSSDCTIPIPEEDTSLSSDISDLPSTNSNISLPAMGVINPTHLQDEPHNPRFRTIQDLLNSTPQLLDYPNFPDLPEEPNPPDLSKLDPMHLDAIRLSNALIASVGEAISEPQTYHEAISLANSTYWQEAMD